jgi:hypothetical protein
MVSHEIGTIRATMQRNMERKIALAATLLTLAFAVCGCASSGNGNFADNLSPSMGGLPADAPARPTTPAVYPAVHDMPPPRTDVVLDDDQQAKLQSDLAALRSRQETETAASKPAGPAKKPAPLSPSSSQAQ